MLNLDELNQEQRLAVETIEGPILMLAGAGSGKTKALTYRIANILEQYKAQPDEILAVTFTNKAAGEMKERVIAAIKNKANGNDLFYMGTFHSICVKILRRDGYLIGVEPNFVIYDTDDSLALIKEVFNKLNLSPKEINPNTVQSIISSAKNELITPREYINIASGFFQLAVARIYPEYQKALTLNNAVDFDDLIMKTIQLMRESPETLEKYQRKFKYIMVDEYQDTNHAQYILVNLFAKLSQNICVVGDEDQSIYKFRGSDIRNILNFERDYPNAKMIKLEQNYRSTQTILKAANEVIKKNTQRRDKKMWTSNNSGDNVTIYHAETEKDEGNFIVERIKEIRDQSPKINNAEEWGKAPFHVESIAVLYRTNAMSRNIEEAFIKNGIPYKLVGGTKFYERREIKDILAYLRVLQNPKDNLSLFRIINTPRRAVGKKIIDELQMLCEDHKCNFGELLTSSVQLKTVSKAKKTSTKKSKTNQSVMFEQTPVEENSKSVSRDITASKPIQNLIQLFTEIYKKTEELHVAELIKYIINRIGYIEYLDDGTDDAQSRIENLQELMSVAIKYEDLTPKGSLEKLLEDLALIEQEDAKNKKDKDKDRNLAPVTLMSVHASKGLEFDTVFIAGMEESIFPHSRSLSDADELEEERRLAYVALTRAKRKLYIIHSQNRTYFGSKQTNARSRFLEDIPEELIDAKEFDYSSSRMYGGAQTENNSWGDFDYAKNYKYSKGKNGPVVTKKKASSKSTPEVKREKITDDWSNWE